MLAKATKKAKANAGKLLGVALGLMLCLALAPTAVFAVGEPTYTTLTGIAITTPPTKTVYTAYEDFDPTGMVVTATYEGGSTAVVTASVTDGAKLKCSKKEITISYTDGEVTKTATQAITVNPGVITSVDVKSLAAPIAGQLVDGPYELNPKNTYLEYTPGTWPVVIYDNDISYYKSNSTELTNALKSGSAATASYMSTSFVPDVDSSFMQPSSIFGAGDSFETGNMYYAKIVLMADNAVFGGTGSSCTFSVNGAPAAFIAEDNICIIYVPYDFTSAKAVTLTLNANGGTCAKASLQTGADGKASSLPEASAAGMSFDGWYTEAGAKVTVDTVFSADTTLYAHYTAEKMVSVTAANVPQPAAGKTVSDVLGYKLANVRKISLSCMPTGAAKLNTSDCPISYYKLTDGEAETFAGYENNSLELMLFTGPMEEMADTDVFEAGGKYLIQVTALTDRDFSDDFTCNVIGSETRAWWGFETTYGIVYMYALVEVPDGTTPTTYTVLYDIYGNGSAFYPQTIESGKTAQRPSNPNWGNKTFLGWYLKDGTSVSDTQFDFTTPITGNITLVAKWKDNTPAPATYTVTFDANGGTCGTTTMTTDASGKLASLPTATWTNLEFVGWIDSKTDSKITTDTVFTKDTTIYARWKISNATFSMTKPEAGKKVSECKDISFTTPAFAKDTDWVFIFDNPTWYEKGNDTPLADDAVFEAGKTYVFNTGGIRMTNYRWVVWSESPAPRGTLFGQTVSGMVDPAQAYAFFEFEVTIPTTYTVSFNMGGHGTSPEAQIVESGKTATKPADPTAEGWAFCGWYADSALTKTFYFTTSITENTTVYAMWKEPIAEATATITEPVAGQYPDITPVSGDDTQYTAGGEASLTEVRWYIGSTEHDKNTAFTAGTEYTPHIAFRAKAGYCFTDSTVFKINGITAEPVACTGNPISIRVAKHTFTATDPATTYTVTFDMNGHGTQIAAQTVKSGKTATKPADPTESGWTFGGWYADSALETAFDFNKAITSDAIVYAKWTASGPADDPAPTPEPGKQRPLPATGDSLPAGLLALLAVSAIAALACAATALARRARARK